MRKNKKKRITQLPRAHVHLGLEIHAAADSFSAGTGTPAPESHVACSRTQQLQAICVCSEQLLHEACTFWAQARGKLRRAGSTE